MPHQINVLDGNLKGTITLDEIKTIPTQFSIYASFGPFTGKADVILPFVLETYHITLNSETNTYEARLHRPIGS